MKHILITGGNGYIGSALTPKLLEAGYIVTVLDLREPNMACTQPGIFTSYTGDIRNMDNVRTALKGAPEANIPPVDTVIHLACISNDPSFDMDPALGKSINYDCFRPLVKECKAAGVRRFIFASSSSVYGVKDTPDVTEMLSLDPMTDYAMYKAKGEDILQGERESGFEIVIARPATVCGMSPHLRLDLCVHILTMQAIRTGIIKVFGGDQFRPNIHIDDMTDAYLRLIEASAEKVDGEVFNIGHDNMTIMQTAELIREIIGENVKIETIPTEDKRSYHVSSQKIGYELGFRPKKTVKEAIIDIKSAYDLGKIPNPDDDNYYAIRRIKAMGLKP